MFRPHPPSYHQSLSKMPLILRTESRDNGPGHWKQKPCCTKVRTGPQGHQALVEGWKSAPPMNNWKGRLGTQLRWHGACLACTKPCINQTRYCVPAIPALSRWRQGNQKMNLRVIVKLNWDTWTMKEEPHGLSGGQVSLKWNMRL